MAERLTIAKIKEAIANADGVIAEAARTLGVSRMTIYRRIEESDDLRAAVEDAREELTDIAERELGKAIRAGNMTAIIFHLKGSPSGRKRGYSERTEITGANGGAIVVKGYARFSPDDWDETPNPNDSPL
jgi:acyl-CoA reductase-like NAD-dependent aldehyde dehydrogenase